MPEAGFVAGGVLLADQHCVPTGKVAVPSGESGDLFWKVLELDLYLIPASVVVRKNCFLEVGVFNRHLAGIDDWDMWTRIAEVRPVLVPKVSVIIPTLNRCALVPHAIESARRAANDVEIIVVDDASEDQTREVCQDVFRHPLHTHPAATRHRRGA